MFGFLYVFYRINIQEIKLYIVHLAFLPDEHVSNRSTATEAAVRVIYLHLDCNYGQHLRANCLAS